ncbi:MAG: hypothetical protein KGQ49_04930 [Verrucomicrobia bacterium]|nr:hypothetical protein [Verrucomicrobiota bacterium]MBU6446724.1 hypothetical protein [Verrucomicrobiota bacterium]MDE3047293.1 hypothetical protein [Verrucomicrobiota bacterium]
MKMIFCALFAGHLFAQSLTNDTLYSLQQLRTVIPERLWEQEFSISIDQNAFQTAAMKLMEHPRKEKTIASSFTIAASKDYFLFATMSGEMIRITDQYQEFEEGAFWKTPDVNDRLEWLEQE